MTGGARSPNAKKLIAASLTETLFVIPGVIMFLRTDDPLWLFGAIVLGSLPTLWWILAAPRARAGADQRRLGADSTGLIVEDARRRR